MIEDAVDGLLFTTHDDFERQAERLLCDPALRQRLGTAGRAKLTRLSPPGREIDRHLALYRRRLAR